MKRILSLLPSATEIVFALGAGDNLVGVTHECDFPEAALHKPRVTSARINPSMPSDHIDELVRGQLDDSGTLYTLDMELLRQLRPEIVLTQQLCTVCAVGFETVRAAMRSLPEPPEVINLEPKNLDDVLGTILDVANMLGVPERGATLKDEIVNRLRSIPSLENPPRVLLLEWLIPPFSAGHWMAELVIAAGATPVLDNRGEYSRQLSWDTIRETAFDVLVISCCGFGIERTMIDVDASAEIRNLMTERPELRIILFDGNHYFSRPGPRLLESAELLHNALAGVAPEVAGASIPRPYVELGNATPG
ncbi:MAG: ABC transporter substrate-binding protein [Bacteroidota bacterium]